MNDPSFPLGIYDITFACAQGQINRPQAFILGGVRTAIDLMVKARSEQLFSPIAARAGVPAPRLRRPLGQ